MKQQFSFEYLSGIARQFLGSVPIWSVERYGKGAINDSFKVVIDNRSFLLQRINQEYFPEPEKLLANFKKIVSVRSNGSGLSAIGLKDNDQLWFKDGSGAYWRLYAFFDNSYSCLKISNIYQAYEIAKAYGQYLAMLSVLPLESLEVVVTDFHNTPRRFEQLVAAENSDLFGRVADCRPELDFVKSQLSEVEEFSKLLAGGQIPERLTHNDTGIDNVLLDRHTGAAVAVIDLDTTMPGYSLWDFGDLLRSALGVEFDDSPDPAECFNALLSGYIAGSGRLLSPTEISNFPLAGRVISLELGIRYLTDYLTGDKVFHYDDGASLLRARKSLLRFKIMKHQTPKFMELIAEVLSVYNR